MKKKNRVLTESIQRGIEDMFACILKHVRMDKKMQISWGGGCQNDCHIKFYFCNQGNSFQGNSFFKQLSEPFPIKQGE